MTNRLRTMASVVVLIALLLILGSWSMAAMAILDPVDFLALQSIRKGLQDMPGSAFFSTWDFTSDPCAFSGVLCDTESRPNKVIALNLGDPRAGSPGLMGKLDASVGSLTELTELTIVPGRVSGAIPETIGKCRQLRFLGISKNLLWGPIPLGVSNLKSLQTLDLSHNVLTGPIPPGLGSLTFLINVFLHHNKLTGGVPPISSPVLARLDLKLNQLSGSLPGSLPSSLVYLSLSWNQLYGRVDRTLSGLRRLNHLDMSFNRFSGSIPGVVFGFPLVSLQLQRNYFGGRVAPLAEVRIPVVDLSYNMLSGEISPMLSSVQSLYLNNNRFTGQVPHSFVHGLLTSRIRILYLQHNYLSGIDLSAAAALPITATFCIQYNCMVPPIQTSCPFKAGKWRTRPPSECRQHQIRT